MQPVRVGLLGLGTVGGGMVNVLARNGEEIARRAGRRIEVLQAAVRDPSRSRICDTAGLALTDQVMEVVDHPDIDVVVELMGGTDAALEVVMAALANGKHVVTANKALIALHGNEIFQQAQARGLMVAFEAAVAGGIPIIKAIREGLAGNRIEWLAGIINGTGNFILTQMREQARDFSEVLAEAQALGYAEADPAFDIEGIDAAHKLAILASIAFGIPLQFERVYTEGITRVTQEDIRHAGELGYVIKHLGIARRREDGVELRVHPTLIPERRLIANVNGVMNAILVQADAVGSTLYYGAGAGAEPTASAVIADLVDVIRAMTTDPASRVPYLAFKPNRMTDLAVLPMADTQTAYYLRMQVDDTPGVLAEIATILGTTGISIEAVVQPEPPKGSDKARLILLTHRVFEKQLTEAIAQMEQLEVVSGSITRIRLEHLNGA